MKANRAISVLMMLLVSISVCVTSGRSQDKKNSDQAPVKLRAELVQIDVLVTDRNHQPVSGLTRADFTLTDNDKPQAITSFAYEETRSRKIADVAAEARSLPRAITVGEVKRVLAFVIDTLHMKTETLSRARKLLDEFIDKQMEPGDLVLILSTSGGSGLVEQFTTDQRLLHRAVSRLHPLYFTNATTPYRSLNQAAMPMDAQSNPGFGRRPSAPTLPSTGISLPAINVDPLEQADARSTLHALDEVIKAMSNLPGRKVSVFMSEGLRIFQTDTHSTLLETAARAARANVVFYTIDPRGLDPLTLGADEDIASDNAASLSDAVNDAANAKRNDFSESQDSLRAIAAETGGKFFGNNNDIKHGLEVFLKENSAYYMLGFQPEDARWDGKFHKIKVVVRNRPDLQVSFRKGYMARGEKTDAQKSTDPKVAEIIEAISSPLVRRDIDMRLTPLYLDDTQREPVVTVLLHIDASKLSFKHAQDTYQDTLDQIGYIYDTGGKVVDQFSNKIDLNLKPQTYEATLKRGLLSTRQLRLQPGLYQVRLFIREIETGLIGTANDSFEVPNFKAERLTMSSLFLQGQGNEAGSEGGTLAHRSFPRSGKFTYQTVIYNAKTDGKIHQPQLEMRTRVLRGSEVVFKGALRPIQPPTDGTPPSRIIIGGTFQMKSLAPDEYTLEITVIDKLRKKDAVVRQEIDFTVE